MKAAIYARVSSTGDRQDTARLVEALQARLAIIPTTDPTQPHCQLIETNE